MPAEHEHEDDPVFLDDDDPELADFFSGVKDFSGEEVEDGGKGLTFLDAEPDKDAIEGLSNEEFWGAASLAAEGSEVSS